MLELGPEQDGDAGDSQRYAKQAAPREPVAAEDEGLQQQKPDRRDRDDEGGKAGGDPLLGPGQSKVASNQ